MAKGLTRPITRKQALSYKRTSPNPIGVTAIAQVNGRRRKAARGRGRSRKKASVRSALGPRAYAARYRATKAVLRHDRLRQAAEQAARH